MSLKQYHAKRTFSKTPEPQGATHPTGDKLAFVVQEHHASQLHYDFRLELGGVLKSWAVPKGPSTDPHEHRLAIQTEDHPFEYRNFEGVIPPGNYGAGNVIIWDQGWYEPRSGDQKTLSKELANGHITFILHGKKLHGEFALIKMPKAEDDAWLLVKKGDEFANKHDITKQDASVKSGKKVDQIGDTPDLTSAPKKSTPWRVHPMLCTLTDKIFDRDGWLFEIKWDGFRAIASKKSQKVELYSRNGTDFLNDFAPVAEAVRSIKHDIILDGEIVAVDQNGNPHFELLQGWRKNPQSAELRYYVFDMLWYDGRDLRDLPLYQRKTLLKQILPKHTALFFSDDIPTRGKALFAEMQKRGLEGVVAKKADSQYREDVRGQDWLKIKTHQRQEVVIGGYTEPRGGRKFIGSLLVGVYKGDSLVYVGHSGGGIPDQQRQELLTKLQKIERTTCPFSTQPKPNAPVHWVSPNLVCEMNFEEWTSEGLMRQPVFKGIRADKSPRSVKRETVAKNKGA